MAGFARCLSQRIVEQERSEQPSRTIIDVAELPDGSIPRALYPGEEDGVPLVYHRWDRACALGRSVMVVHFSLVFTAATADRPAWRRLAETMDQEIRAAEITMPSRAQQR